MTDPFFGAVLQNLCSCYREITEDNDLQAK